jgi:hypothetical protein
MVVSFGPACHPLVDRRASPSGHRVKATSLTLGSTRSRLIQVLRHLGLYRERIEARLRDEREMAQALEMEKQIQLHEEREAVQRDEQARHARLHEEEQSARLAEGLRAARLLREEMAYESMSEEQRAVWRLEDEILAWLTASDEDWA